MTKDIEREAFETLPEVAKLYQACKERDLTIAERGYLKGARDAWQAAKAQAIPEGFVLVPVDTLEECLNWADIAKWDSPSNEVDKKIAHHEAIIESAISAQEPTND